LLTNLSVQNFRNISLAELNFEHSFQLFFGANGAGKSSLLESIYYLSHGRSFRTSTANSLVQHNCQKFTIIARGAFNEKPYLIGAERDTNGTKTLKINGDSCRSLINAAKTLPTLFVSTKSYDMFIEGPKPRRQFLDWGTFHVEQYFIQHWQSYQSGLKQRNAAIKSKCSSAEICAWDQQLSDAANTISAAREHYKSLLEQELNALLSLLLPELSHFSLEYQRGWPNEQVLSDTLKQCLIRDRSLGYTSQGPQRADLQLLISGRPVKEVLSQGQLKLAAYAFYLAQGSIYCHHTEVSPLYLIDDLPSELTAEKQNLVLQHLMSIKAQVFITAIDKTSITDVLPSDKTSVFHVKQGVLS